MNTNELRELIKNEIINTAEACEILGCTRQNIDKLVTLNKLIPIKIYPRDKIFLKSDILERANSKPSAGRPKKD